MTFELCIKRKLTESLLDRYCCCIFENGKVESVEISLQWVNQESQWKLFIVLCTSAADAKDHAQHDSVSATADGHRRRCHCCLQKIAGKSDYKKKKTRLMKVKISFEVCGKACAKHTIKRCRVCLRF